MENGLSILGNAGTHVGFWRRQFGEDTTRPQTLFDVLFGILMPVVCFLLDPGIIKGSILPGSSPPLLPFKLFIYSVSAMAIVSLAAWLIAGPRASMWSGFLAGAFLAGAFVSFAIGCLISPLTALGLIVLIGLLGLTPFLTAFVYLRNAVRALRMANFFSRRHYLIAMTLCVMAIVAGVPAIGQMTVTRMASESIDQVLHSDASIDNAIARLRYLSSFADLDRIVVEYGKETDPARKDRLEKAYKEITGESLNESLFEMID